MSSDIAPTTGFPALLTRVLDWVAPRLCPGCGAAATTALCSTCRTALVDLDVPEPTATSEIAVRAAFAYTDLVASIIHAAKYRDGRSALAELAEIAAQRVGALAPWQRPAAVIALPLGAARQRSRGYNQADVIARALARELDVPRVEGLVRTRETAPQVGTGRAERSANVAGAFAWRGSDPPPVAWIVDDVHTTGATLGAAVDALAAAGTPPAGAFVVARASAPRGTDCAVTHAYTSSHK